MIGLQKLARNLKEDEFKMSFHYKPGERDARGNQQVGDSRATRNDFLRLWVEDCFEQQPRKPKARKNILTIEPWSHFGGLGVVLSLHLESMQIACEHLF